MNRMNELDNPDTQRITIDGKEISKELWMGV